MPFSAQSNAPNMVIINAGLGNAYILLCIPPKKTNTKIVQCDGLFLSGLVKDYIQQLWTTVSERRQEVGHTFPIVSLILIPEGK